MCRPGVEDTMNLSTRPEPYIIPSYSLTGDLLSYLNCGRQYRYHNRGALPPSKPVQLWFGEFIHGVMEEAYRRWNEQRTPLPWDEATLENLEDMIIQRLAARGLFYSQPSVLDLSRKRARVMIKEIGPDLFPMIDSAEVRLQGIRTMPSLNGAVARANYYEVKGVVDVLSSLRFSGIDPKNRLWQTIMSTPTIQQMPANPHIRGGSEFEVILDYKGMRRPPRLNLDRFEWQIQTYAWLRDQQPNAHKVLAGILIFVNELVPSRTDMEALWDEVYGSNGITTDVPPTGRDANILAGWRKSQGQFPSLSFDYRLRRALHIVPVTPDSVNHALSQFDQVVSEIESSVCREKSGQSIPRSWKAVPKPENCTVCDFKYFCDKSESQGPPLAP